MSCCCSVTESVAGVRKRGKMELSGGNFASVASTVFCCTEEEEEEADCGEASYASFAFLCGREIVEDLLPFAGDAVRRLSVLIFSFRLGGR